MVWMETTGSLHCRKCIIMVEWRIILTIAVLRQHPDKFVGMRRMCVHVCGFVWGMKLRHCSLSCAHSVPLERQREIAQQYCTIFIVACLKEACSAQTLNLSLIHTHSLLSRLPLLQLSAANFCRMCGRPCVYVAERAHVRPSVGRTLEIKSNCSLQGYNKFLGPTICIETRIN